MKSQEVICRGVVQPGGLLEAGGRQTRQDDEGDPRMNIHEKARLTPHGRAGIVRDVVELGRSARTVSRTARVCEKTVRKWVQRATWGEPLTDRSSRLHRSPQAAPLMAERFKKTWHRMLQIDAMVHAQRPRASCQGVAARCRSPLARR